MAQRHGVPAFPAASVAEVSVREDVTADDGRYVTAYRYEVGAVPGAYLGEAGS
ncbi:hypothetical protein [Streptomyces halobius]|uniref:Uncharacterized protein n=1 Tax=Streptomyces halobius TaxID=2879846 RepID=A0ABY4M6R1_9ACTN|nr:hypothetical protein [Streptomyces halobius]UQA92071.1 hypothetical protein K9S39_09625 [Streptomyces halobius]